MTSTADSGTIPRILWWLVRVLLTLGAVVVAFWVGTLFQDRAWRLNFLAAPRRIAATETVRPEALPQFPGARSLLSHGPGKIQKKTPTGVWSLAIYSTRSSMREVEQYYEKHLQAAGWRSDKRLEAGLKRLGHTRVFLRGANRLKLSLKVPDGLAAGCEYAVILEVIPRLAQPQRK